jgi:RHS repeat-associated protein
MSYAPFGEGYAGGQQYEQFTGINAGTVFDTENQTGSLEDFMFRRYSPVQGRWISPDPAGLGAVDPSNPQSWNRYAYVMNSPLNWVDPLGLGPCGGRPCVYMPPDNYPGDEFDWLETSFWSDISGEDAFYVLAFPGAGGPCAFGLCGDINAAANNGNSICGNAKGKTIPVRAPFGQINFQFNDQGNLIGLGLQLTGANGLQDSGLGIPPNTFVGFSQLSPGTVQFGFSNPVQVGSGFSQAYFQTATFSGGSFTSVQGAYAPLGIPFGSSSGNSSLLQWALNGQVPFTSGLSSQAYNIGSTLTSLASLVSSNVSCKDVFGGG